MQRGLRPFFPGMYSTATCNPSFTAYSERDPAAQVPYAGLSGIQAALAVMHRGLRPDIPSHTPAPLAQLIQVGGVIACHTAHLKC
jgi:hypothetical protein